MGLLFEEHSGQAFDSEAEHGLLNRLGCKACPLDSTPGKIDATGASSPKIYILGEAAGREEEKQRRQFVGPAGKLLRQLLPKEAFPLIRWNNILNCKPPNNRTPEKNEVECCRSRVVTDISNSKPDVIWGFGNIPLQWVSGFSGITYWRGRRMPIKVREHTCWYYAFLHPSFLLRIARDNGEDFGSEDERMTAFDLRQAFAELEGLPRPVVHDESMARANVDCLTDLPAIEEALNWAAAQHQVGVDYETNCLRPYESGAKILTAAVGTPKRAFAFPIWHPGSGFKTSQVETVLALWKKFLLEASCVKLVHNLAFELEWSGYFFGEETLRAQPWEDTANAAAILDERKGKTKPGCFSLEFLVQQYFGFNLKKISNLDRAQLANAPLHAVLLYNGMDAKYHAALWEKLWEAIEHEGFEFPYELARRRVPTVVLSQLKGVPVDQERLKVLEIKYSEKITKAEQQIETLPIVRAFNGQHGRQFNSQSNPDVLTIFDSMLRCPEVQVVDKYTKEKKRSADEQVLTKIIENHDPESAASCLARALMGLREASGTKSKYIDSLLLGSKSCVVYPDGLIHASFNTFFASTGRLSADTPNLQNFPKRDAETKEVRRPIRAPRNHVILASDYGQIEARVIAVATKDKAFCKALWERYDVHQEWAERLAYDYPERVGGRKNLKDKKVMKAFRTDVKNQWTFPLFFGAKDTSVAGYLNIPLRIVRPHVEAFWREFEGVKIWQEGLLASYNECGYVECLTGRRRRGPLSVNQIYNSPIQGTAAEIVMDAMSRLSETGDPELQPELNVHDDLTFLRVPEREVDRIAEKVLDIMLYLPFEWSRIVPWTLEMSVGENWCDLEEIGIFSSDTWRK